ncbi:hypothetical protein BaRGS_00010656 [Batillaria attramentaria]|uniref:Uncharacterized protein n=1 Tax=Batillaria attramentaria TaxID=370345 RepID=A0ABD0LF72_9CAEN
MSRWLSRRWRMVFCGAIRRPDRHHQSGLLPNNGGRLQQIAIFIDPLSDVVGRAPYHTIFHLQRDTGVLRPYAIWAAYRTEDLIGPISLAPLIGLSHLGAGPLELARTPSLFVCRRGDGLRRLAHIHKAKRNVIFISWHSVSLLRNIGCGALVRSLERRRRRIVNITTTGSCFESGGDKH